jgi:hypothetical protein
MIDFCNLLKDFLKIVNLNYTERNICLILLKFIIAMMGSLKLCGGVFYSSFFIITVMGNFLSFSLRLI